MSKQVIPSLNTRFIALITLLLSALHPQALLAIDVVNVPTQQSSLDKRANYKHEVIVRALELTKSKFGPYEFNIVDKRLSRSRALRALEEGKLINLYISFANETWDQKAIPVTVPIRLGLLSYRVLLVHKDELHKFANVHSLEDLKKLSVGLQSDWAITDVFRQSGFDVVTGSNFDGTFEMLQYKRFDFLPRGIHEVYDELKIRSGSIKDVVIEPRLAIFLRAVSYAYVSPNHPRIAERIQEGLGQMANNGELLNILNKYHADDIKKAKLGKRKVIFIDNPFFESNDIVDQAEFWYSPVN